MIIGQDAAPRARLGGAQAEALDGALGQPLQLLEGGRHLGAQLLELDAQPRHLVRVRVRARARVRVRFRVSGLKIASMAR